MEKIYLIGFMGAGKSTIGKLLAKKLIYEFIDMDGLFEKRFALTIKDFFENFGESYFRDKERDLLHEVKNMEKVVIATGGGLPVFYDNMDVMKQTGFVVYLKVDGKTLIDRVMAQNEKNKRPLAISNTKKELFSLLKKREPYYLKANITIDCNEKFPQKIVDEIIKEFFCGKTHTKH